MKKNCLLLVVAVITMAISGCKKPEACLNASSSSLKLGQSTTFSNCSTNSYDFDLDFGDGKSATQDNNDLAHTYGAPGVYTAKLTVWNKKNKKSDETSISVSVSEPSESEIIGTWDYFKVESWDTFFYAPELTSSYAPNQTYIFASDTVDIDGYKYTWGLAVNAELTIGSNIYTITKLYNDEMVLKVGNSYGYDLLYFR